MKFWFSNFFEINQNMTLVDVNLIQNTLPLDKYSLFTAHTVAC